MVTQEGTTITIPAHELAMQGAHSVTMVTTDGSDEQVTTVEWEGYLTWHNLLYFTTCCTLSQKFMFRFSPYWHLIKLFLLQIKNVSL